MAKRKKLEKQEMIDKLIEQALTYDKTFVELVCEILGQTRADWLDGELQNFDEWRLGVIYEQLVV